MKGAFGVAEDTRDSSIACRQIGPIRIKGEIKDGERVFDERPSARTPATATKAAAPARRRGRPPSTTAKAAGGKRSSSNLGDRVLALATGKTQQEIAAACKGARRRVAHRALRCGRPLVAGKGGTDMVGEAAGFEIPKTR
jgi:hypothetical protein